MRSSRPQEFEWKTTAIRDNLQRTPSESITDAFASDRGDDIHDPPPSAAKAPVWAMKTALRTAGTAPALHSLNSVCLSKDQVCELSFPQQNTCTSGSSHFIAVLDQ